MKLAHINAGTHKTCAFFDVDGTIINTKSVFSFLEFANDMFTSYNGDIFKDYYNNVYTMMKSNYSRELINRYYYRIFRNIPVVEVKKAGISWYKTVSRYDCFFNRNSLDIIKEHQNNNIDIILVSGSFEAVLSPLSQHFGCSDILCTDLEIINDRYTGELNSEPCIGFGKSAAIQRYCLDHNVSLDTCYAYGDDPSDTPMLNLVKYPNLVSPDEIYSNQRFLIKDW